jgi:DNA-binding winged helix-turn-helix (wHTH) protein/Flp pilus assembly protein TadD
MQEHIRIGSFAFDPQRRWLVRNGERVRLGPKVIETLAVLIENAGELVTKEQLMEHLWPNQFVEEANLTQNVYRLRRILAEGGLSDAIETIPCRGYRFVSAIDSVRAQRNWGIRSFAAVFVTLVACAVVVAFALHRSPDAFVRLSGESQRLYTLGRYHWNANSDVSQVEASLPYFRRVVRLDPRNPLGYSGLADAYVALFDMRCNSQLTGCRQIATLAVANAKRAVALDRDSAEARTSLAMVQYDIDHRYAESDFQFRRALALDPRYALAHHWYANSLVVRGWLIAAEAEYKAAETLEPTSPGTYGWLAEDEYFRRNYREAVTDARVAIEIDGHRPMTWIVLGLAYEQLGDVKAAITSFDHLPAVRREAFLADLYARTGQRRRAISMLRRLGTNGDCIELALAWRTLGNSRLASRILGAAPAGNWMERSFLAMDPHAQNLRSDPEFAHLTAGGSLPVAAVMFF